MQTDWQPYLSRDRSYTKHAVDYDPANDIDRMYPYVATACGRELDPRFFLEAPKMLIVLECKTCRRAVNARARA